MRFRYNPNWASHLPVLIKTFEISEGPVLELGSGPFSTPVLHWLCLERKRKLTTYENNRQYFDLNKRFMSGDHQMIFVDDWDKIVIDTTHWGLVFVDHDPPDRRKTEIKRIAKIADYIVVHDTEKESDDKYRFREEIFPLFTYRYNYRRKKPYTTVLSINKDLTNFHLT